MDAIVVIDPGQGLHVFAPYDRAEDAVNDIGRLKACGIQSRNKYSIRLASFADPSEIQFMIEKTATIKET